MKKTPIVIISVLLGVFVIAVVGRAVFFRSVAARNEQAASALNNEEIAERTDNEPVTVSESWLTDGYWFYMRPAQQGMFVFSLDFTDKSSFEYTLYTVEDTVEEQERDADNSVKLFLSTNKAFGKWISEGKSFYFDDDKGKLYYGNDDLGYMELRRYNDTSESNLKDAVSKYNGDSENLQYFYEYEAEYDLDSVQLDYTDDTKTSDSSLEFKPALRCEVAMQGDYYYYYNDENEVYKISKEQFEEDDVYSEIVMMQDDSDLTSIEDIEVCGNYIYLLGYEGEQRVVCRYPTTRSDDFYAETVAQGVEPRHIFLYENYIYYMKAEKASATTQDYYLYRVGTTSECEEEEVYLVADSDDEFSWCNLCCVRDGYAYFDLRKKTGYDTERYWYSQMNLETGKESRVESEYGHGLFEGVHNGKGYVYSSPKTLVIDFSKKQVKESAVQGGTFLGMHDDYQCVRYDNGTFLTNKELSAKEKGYRISKDPIQLAYLFDEDVFYRCNDDGKLYRVEYDGDGFYEVDDIGSLY